MKDTIGRLERKESLTVLGMMSGTSLDGVDVALVEIAGVGKDIDWKLLHFSSYPFTNNVRLRIVNCLDGMTGEICRLNFDLGHIFGNSALRAVEEAGVNLDDIDLVGSHGQTLYHIDGHSSLQVGEASVIAEILGTPVIADFRVRDVAAGGAGAPLVPYVDFVLLASEMGRLVLNVGGIANFTVLPAGVKDTKGISAWDTGPGNMVIDEAVKVLTDGEEPFDRDGLLAASGNVRNEWLDILMEHPFIHAEPPKSTGREDFGIDYFKEMKEKFGVGGEKDNIDFLSTLTRFTAESVFLNYREYVELNVDIHEVIVSGGGAKNSTLMSHLSELFSPIDVVKSDQYGIPADAKEAIAFAILASEAVNGRKCNLPSVTGASKPVVLGKLIPG